MSRRRPTTSRPARRPRRAVAAASAVLVLAAGGCSPPVSDGGRLVVPATQRVAEVAEVREVLAAPVPELRAEAAALGEAVRELRTSEDESEVRARRAGALDLAPARSAVASLGSVELAGEGPDVVAAGESLLAAVEAETAEIVAVAEVDAELLELTEGWDRAGSYNEQLAAFDELEAAGTALAARLDEREDLVPCLGLWPRRAAAATTFVDRTAELRVLVRDRRGQEFDDLRDQLRQDPFGLGETLGRADGAAASACWDDETDVAPPVAAIEDGVGRLAAVLDPEDLRG